MPRVQLLPSAKPDPFAYQNTQAFMKILQTLGEYETIRQKKMLSTDILGVLSSGGGIEEIAGVVQQHQQPQFDTGVRGLFQRISAPFAQQPGRGITDMILKGTISQAFAQRSKIQELLNEGYTPEEAKMIRDISHGIKPRASARAQYESMSEIEKLDFLSKVKQRAEGQYYGIEAGNVQPRDPILLDWTLRELDKLPQYRKQVEKPGVPEKPPETPPVEPPEIIPPEITPQAAEGPLRRAAGAFFDIAQKPLLEPVGRALPGKKPSPTKTAKPTGEFATDFKNGMEAIKQGADPNQVYLRLSDEWGKNPEYEKILYNEILKKYLGFP